MKNSIITLVTIVGVVVVGFGTYTLFRNSPQPDSVTKKGDTTEPQEVMMKKEDSVTESDKMMDTKTAESRYEEYSKAILDNSSSSRRVLFFYASWCSTCKPADTNFKENVGKIPEDTTLIRVNYNDPETDQEEKDLAKKYGITYQHTFVQIDSMGKEITTWNGGQINELLSKIK